MTSSNEVLRKRVESVLDMALSTVSSLTESYASGVSLIQEKLPIQEKGRADALSPGEYVTEKPQTTPAVRMVAFWLNDSHTLNSDLPIFCLLNTFLNLQGENQTKIP